MIEVKNKKMGLSNQMPQAVLERVMFNSAIGAFTRVGPPTPVEWIERKKSLAAFGKMFGSPLFMYGAYKAPQG